MGMNILMDVESAGTSWASSPCSPASTIWVYIWSQEAPGRLRQSGCRSRRAPSSSGSYPRLTQPTWTFWASKTELALCSAQASASHCWHCLLSGAGAGIILLCWHLPLSEWQEAASVEMHNMQDERGKHLKHLKQSLQESLVARSHILLSIILPWC